MKVTSEYSGGFFTHSLTKYNSNSVLLAYDTIGDVAGIVSQCCGDIITENDVDGTHHVCSLVYKNIGTCRVFCTVSTKNPVAYSDGICASATVTNEISYILPKLSLQTGDYQNGGIAQFY